MQQHSHNSGNLKCKSVLHNNFQKMIIYHLEALNGRNGIVYKPINIPLGV